MFQISTLLSQRQWFKVKDFDDCWVLVQLMLVLAVTPWRNIVNVETFRANAGDPDDGKSDGGNSKESVLGVEATYPEYKGKLRIYKNVNRTDAILMLDAGHPLSIHVMPGKLPERLQHGVNNVPHECALLKQGNRYMFANPWALMPDRWQEVRLSEVFPAMRDYTDGNGLSFIRYPTVAQMLITHPLYNSTFPEAVNSAVNEAYVNGWNKSIERAGEITAKAAGEIRSGTLT